MAKDNAIKTLCQNGGFSLFMQLCDQIEPPEIKYSHNVNDLIYLLGRRDGMVEMKNELYSLIKKLATE